MILTGSLLLLTVLASSGGHLSVSRAMKQVGEVKAISLAGLSAMAAGAIRQRWLWVGIALNAVAFYTMLSLLTREDLSFVVPACSSSYIVGTLGARFLLGEQVCWRRWAGVVLVGAGVALTIVG